MQDLANHMLDHLAFVYGRDAGPQILVRLQKLLDRYRTRLPPPAPRTLSEKDAIVITYGDMVQQAGERPLQTLARFFDETIQGAVSGVHILPFFPYSSDDGFSVIDYHAVDPKLGTWADVERVGRHFRLMFDAVVNHISAHSGWFQAFLRDEEPYTDYFIVVDPDVDLSAVFRPRALPLLTPFETPGGTKHVWTTFSADQIDLNFENPDVLLAVTDVLLDYAAHGADFIRLDAIGFMWKTIGTSSLHLPQTHALIQLWRLILDAVAPQVALITETNVPHKDNIAYFGNGYNEAQMVYNFTLPPLTLHAFHTAEATHLTNWAQTLTLPSDQVTFFNFLASHDGIGVTPARGILSDADIDAMCARVEQLGGFVSYKTNADGTQSAYELNISYVNALGNPEQEESAELKARRFLAAQAIMLALRGVPGIYFHSLFGSQNWREGVEQTGRYRTINREKVTYTRLTAELADPHTLRHQIFSPYRHLLTTRAAHPAFHPNGRQEIMTCHPAVFAVLRGARAGDAHVLCLQNVANQTLFVSISLRETPLADANTLTNLISGKEYSLASNAQLALTLAPYEVVWLANK